jgi:hypothetical protein
MDWKTFVAEMTKALGIADAILGLRNIRNLTVHAPPHRLSAAREFISMVEAIMGH